MTTEVQEYKTDPDTGLPELPEGMFWRVGKHDPEPYGYVWTREPYDAVMLMTTQTREVKIPGKPTKKWWSFLDVREEQERTEIETRHLILMSRAFDQKMFAPSKDKIPSYGVFHAVSPQKDLPDAVLYATKLNPEGIAYLAGAIWREHLEYTEEKRQKAEAKRLAEENRERLFGDYPPKTLTVA